MTPAVEIFVVPGSVFCIKVMSALIFKDIQYRMIGIHPAKLKKKLPAPHLVPVLREGTTMVPDSKAILEYVDKRYYAEDRPLYPAVTPDRAAARHWGSVEELEKFGHDVLSMLYNYFGAVTADGQRNVTKPFIKSLIPAPVATILPFLPTVGAHAARRQILSRITPVLGQDVVASEQAATKKLIDSLKRLEDSFTEPGQRFLFATDTPTAADFAVFAPLKRLLHPLPDVAGGIGAGCPNALEKAGGLPKLKAFFEYMNEHYYEGKVDWTTLKI